MNSTSPLRHMASAIYSALFVDLHDVDYMIQSYEDRRNNLPGEPAKRRPTEGEISVTQFPQTWGSTSLGFGGLGGSAFTTSDTTVVECGKWAAVYFGGRFAYLANVESSDFKEDIVFKQLKPVCESAVYL